MKKQTLKEVCEKQEVTRRAVQGYEKAGLVKPSGKNKYGHLLYDEEAQQIIAQIKFYQTIGFELERIRELLKLKPKILVEILEKQIVKMQTELGDLKSNILKTKELIRKLERMEENESERKNN